METENPVVLDGCKTIDLLAGTLNDEFSKLKKGLL